MNVAMKLGVGALALTMAMPAHAAVIINFNGVTTDQNVLFASSTNVATPTLVAATNQTSTPVTFANSLGLLANASGQSSTTNNKDGLTGLTTVNIASGFTFSTASFNIAGTNGGPPPVESTSVLVEALGAGGAVIGSQVVSPLGAGGENRIGISGTAGELFTGFRITLNPAGSYVDSLSQVRLGGVARVAAPVPEPAAWMLMLLGFGGIGFTMRKRKVSTQARVRFA